MNKKFLITIAVMSATLIQVLDTTIVNVALPHMEGSLSATADQITWVLTSYLVASAIFMPLTGYFTDVLGRKKYLLLSIAGFILTSLLCGLATNITQIVLFRMLQGVFGAALVPLSQAIMTDVFPVEERGTAMAIWGIGVMVGPVLGPTLGGYLTEIASWRWNFYINLPIGIFSLLLSWYVVPDTQKKSRDMDWVGLLYISLAIGATQLFLDRGNNADWFNSRSMCITAFLAVLSFLLFLLHSLENKEKRVFDISMFNDRNFTIACIMMALFGLGLFGAMVILPLMLENLFNYPVLTTGLVMAPRGLSGMFSMFIVGKLIRKIEPRRLITLGIIISGIGVALSTKYNMDINKFWIIFPNVLQGFGLGFIFVPLSAVAFSTLPEHLRGEGAGLFSLLRTLGSSVGISVIITLFSRHTQISWNELGGFINPYNPAVTQYLNSAQLSLSSPVAPDVLANTLSSQAQMISFIDVYKFIAWSFIIALPLVFLIKKPDKRQPLTTHIME